MTLSEVYTLLKKTNLPVVYNAWEEGTAPNLPYIVYRQTGSNNFGADNKVYFFTKPIDVELYTKTKAPATEALVEAEFDNADIYWSKTEMYLDDEKCFEVLYEIEV